MKNNDLGKGLGGKSSMGSDIPKPSKPTGADRSGANHAGKHTGKSASDKSGANASKSSPQKPSGQNAPNTTPNTKATGSGQSQNAGKASDAKVNDASKSHASKNPSAQSNKSSGDKSTSNKSSDAHAGVNKPTNQNQSESSGEGLGDKAKNFGADATGVDYSDKSMKDRLEHQAADVAMDATPGLGQVNQGRKALKDINKKKREAGLAGDEPDVLDKTEEVADKAVDAGIKTAKYGIGGAVGAQAGIWGATMALFLKSLMFLKGMVVGALAKIAGFFAGIFNAIAGFFSGLLGIGALAGQIIVAGVITVMSASGVLTVYTFVNDVVLRDDGEAHCVPAQTKVGTGARITELEGEVDALKHEMARKVYSVLHSVGGNDTAIAALLGNMEAESGLDPTTIETVGDITGGSERFRIGPVKQKIINADFSVHATPAKANIGGVYMPYGQAFPLIVRLGTGLVQWTDTTDGSTRQTGLINYAEEQGMDWFDIDLQLRFMVAGDEPYRTKQLAELLQTEFSNIDEASDVTMHGYIGQAVYAKDLRRENSRKWLLTLKTMAVDEQYANSILSDLSVSKSKGNRRASSYYQDDGCGNPIIDHYANKALDGTGTYPPELSGGYWTPDELPEALKEFARDPADVGLAYGASGGWASNILPGQCVGYSVSHFMLLYPDWNKEGRPTQRPFGNGRDQVNNWSAHYGESPSDVPQGGAVFSDVTTSQYGHTGIVSHVFENGDILIIEQNVPGKSGDLNGTPYTWSYRIVTQESYTAKKYTFFKPAEYEPRWSLTGED